MSIESLHNEAQLVEAMQDGSEEAFTILYRHYSPQLYVNILGMVKDPLLAEEIIQDLFTRVWQKRDSKGLAENFPGYIYKIGQHLVHDFFRKLQRERKLLEKFRSYAESNYDHIGETLFRQQSTAILQEAINQLSPQQKKVYELIRVEGYTYKKAAEILDISSWTVKEYLVAANKSIQHYISSRYSSLIPLLLYLYLR